LVCAVAVVTAGIAPPLLAQTTPSAATQPAPATTTETRPATTTFQGDTGLWFVPTAEILPDRKVSVSAYRVNFDRQGGSSDISLWPITVAFGVKDRVEIFGSLSVQNRIDRDTRPLFSGSRETGGVVNDYPFVGQGWSTGIGDLTVGAKFNILAEHRQQPAALAARVGVKLPTGDEDEGVASGKADFFIDGIVSKELRERVELAGYGGFMVRGEPDGFSSTNAFRWGLGAGFPSRAKLRLTTEFFGDYNFDDVTTAEPTATPLTEDGSTIPPSSILENPAQFALGVTFLHKGFFAGAGLTYNLNLDGVGSGSKTGFQVRLGYHPGVKIYVPPPPPPPPPTPPPPAGPQNRPPTVRARCEPCTIEVGRTSTVTADAQDPDGDMLRYRWSVPAGTLANAADRQTVFTAPNREGPVPATVTVDDGRGGTASDTVTIQVVAPPRKEYVFEDVHFDFDRYTLRQEALRVLDEAITAMQADATLQLTVEGHTCNIGTAEYNLALGERRATAVRDYLTSRGIGANRLRTVSYGEERPKHDNSREETRRLNRRAAMVVRLQ
jgi:outer membrane protein OmpA-like peptidoglycan-associated protein